MWSVNKIHSIVRHIMINSSKKYELFFTSTIQAWNIQWLCWNIWVTIWSSLWHHRTMQQWNLITVSPVTAGPLHHQKIFRLLICHNYLLWKGNMLCSQIQKFLVPIIINYSVLNFILWFTVATPTSKTYGNLFRVSQLLHPFKKPFSENCIQRNIL